MSSSLIAALNVAWFAAAVWTVRRRHSDVQWWRAVIGDRVAVGAGLAAGMSAAAMAVASAQYVGLPSAALIGLTVTAIVARVRQRRRSA